ncbi:hypothetical protein E4656_12405 [Natronospirillum operosum]|uniref:SCP2 domain-containing protein n=2 Tax=Natronospirillum operosum TaxID=2759953 RepID=A0A4Z0W852_9GAMM|nr:hypothetical protein E4656_12405 [Natronospirillum operosum]
MQITLILMGLFPMSTPDAAIAASPVARCTHRILRQSLRHMPVPLFTRLLADSANRLLRPQLQNGELAFLQGQHWEITLTDIPMTFYLTLGQHQRLVVTRTPQEPDVAFRGPLESFLVLTLQWEDPDTLFFNRRLMVSGNTELGLEIKNFMHGLEATEVLPEPVYRILAALYRALTGLTPAAEGSGHGTVSQAKDIGPGRP